MKYESLVSTLTHEDLPDLEELMGYADVRSSIDLLETALHRESERARCWSWDRRERMH